MKCPEWRLCIQSKSVCCQAIIGIASGTSLYSVSSDYVGALILAATVIAKHNCCHVKTVAPVTAVKSLANVLMKLPSQSSCHTLLHSPTPAVV